MYQSDRGSYRTHENLFSMFYHTCLGKLVILAAILGVLAVIAHLTRPSEQKMRAEMLDNIRQCIESPDSLHTDAIDDAVANLGYIFTNADSVVDVALLNNFKKYNRLEFYDRWLYTSMHVFNNFHSDGIRCGVGIFGLVIPTVNFNDLLLRVGPVRKDYNQPIIEYSEDEYFGTTPDLIFHEGDYE